MVPASRKNPSGPCPLFVFQGLSTAQTARLERIRAARPAWRTATGWRFSTSSSVANRLARCCGSSSTGPNAGAGAAGGRGRDRGVPARQPRPERAARRRRGRDRRGGAREELHARSVVAGAGSAAAPRSGLPALRRTAGEAGDDRTDDGQSAFAGRLAGVEVARSCWRRVGRCTACRSRGSSAGSSQSNSRGVRPLAGPPHRLSAAPDGGRTANTDS